MLGNDPYPNAESERAGVAYCQLDELLELSDIVTLHCPLNDQSRHLIDSAALGRMKPGAILINTSRGAVVDTRAVIESLKRQHLGGLAIDVYEEEDALFFENRSGQTIMDDQFVRLLSFPNVLVTGHQGFFTQEALTAIAETTIANIDAFERSGEPLHPVHLTSLLFPRASGTLPNARSRSFVQRATRGPTLRLIGSNGDGDDAR